MMMQKKKLLSHLEALFNWNKESMEAIGLEERFLFVDNHTLVEASNAVITDVK